MCELNIEKDSREKIEADVLKYYTYTTSTLMWPDDVNIKKRWVSVSMDTVLEWLDRQAAITKRETLHDNPTCSGRSTCTVNRPISESADRETSDIAEIDVSKDEINDFDIWSVAYEIYCAGGYVDNGNEPNPPIDGICELLDRQAAITRREVLCNPDERDEQIAELQSDLEVANEQNKALKAYIFQMQGGRYDEKKSPIEARGDCSACKGWIDDGRGGCCIFAADYWQPDCPYDKVVKR